jgi:transposase-like protein
MEIENPPIVKERKQIGRATKYTPEYYMMMCRHIEEEGLTYRKAAKMYNVSHGVVNHWLKLYRSGQMPGKIKKAKQKVESQENLIHRQERYIRSLKTEIGELYLENQMLKKAQMLFQQGKSANSSVITSENLDQWQKDVK